MDKIYVLFMDEGSYDDYRQYPIGVFTNAVDAEIAKQKVVDTITKFKETIPEFPDDSLLETVQEEYERLETIYYAHPDIFKFDDWNECIVKEFPLNQLFHIEL